LQTHASLKLNLLQLPPDAHTFFDLQVLSGMPLPFGAVNVEIDTSEESIKDTLTSGMLTLYDDKKSSKAVKELVKFKVQGEKFPGELVDEKVLDERVIINLLSTVSSYVQYLEDVTWQMDTAIKNKEVAMQTVQLAMQQSNLQNRQGKKKPLVRSPPSQVLYIRLL